MTAGDLVDLRFPVDDDDDWDCARETLHDGKSTYITRHSRGRDRRALSMPRYIATRKLMSGVAAVVAYTKTRLAAPARERGGVASPAARADRKMGPHGRDGTVVAGAADHRRRNGRRRGTPSNEGRAPGGEGSDDDARSQLAADVAAYIEADVISYAAQKVCRPDGATGDDISA